MSEQEYQELRKDLNDEDPVTRLLGISQVIAFTEAHVEYRTRTINLLNVLLRDIDEDVRETASDSLKFLIGDQRMQQSQPSSLNCPLFEENTCTEKAKQEMEDSLCKGPNFLSCPLYQKKSQEVASRSQEEKKKETGWILSCIIIIMIIIMIIWRFMTGY